MRRLSSALLSAATLAVFFALTPHAGWPQQTVQFGGGDGSTQGKAIVIQGASNEFEGIRAEHVWIAAHHPRWRLHDQALINKQARSFDVMRYEAPDGTNTVWFDITDFFGKY